MWAPDEFMETLYKKENTSSFDPTRKTEMQNKVEKLLGDFSSYLPISTEIEEIERREFKEYILSRVLLTTLDYLKMPTYILYPKNAKGKLPAVIALHGHGYGSKEIVGLTPDGEVDLEAPGIHKHFAVRLVQKGVVVIAPELVGFGDRKLEQDQECAPKENSCYTLASHLLLYGKTLAGLRVFETKRAIDFAETLPQIDSSRIGCVGFSGGGLVAAFTSATDERIKATILSGYTNLFKKSIMNRRHCLDNYIPGIMSVGEMPEIIGLISPRPLFIEAGKKDHLFTEKYVKRAHERLEEIYTGQQARQNLEMEIFDGAHEVHGQSSFEWLQSQLKGDSYEK